MPVSSIVPASGRQDALDARPHVLRGDKFTSVGRRDAALYRLGEARIVVEKARDGFLSEFIDVASVTGRDSRKPGFLIGRQANFHTREISSAARMAKSSMISMRYSPSRA